MSRASYAELQAKLQKIDEAIASHPFNAPDAVAVREVIEEFEAEGSARVEHELALRSLPDLVENGRMVARGLASYARLSRRRRKVMNKLDRLAS